MQRITNALYGDVDVHYGWHFIHQQQFGFTHFSGDTNDHFYAHTMKPEHYKLARAKQTKCNVTWSSVILIPWSVSYTRSWESYWAIQPLCFITVHQFKQWLTWICWRLLFSYLDLLNASRYFRIVGIFNGWIFHSNYGDQFSFTYFLTVLIIWLRLICFKEETFIMCNAKTSTTY